MKIRNGFVSNSSSCSFTLGVRGEKLEDSKLLKVFKVEKNSPLYELTKVFAKILIVEAKPIGYRELAERYSRDEDFAKIIKLKEEGFSFYEGSISDEDFAFYGAEAVLCNHIELDYKDDELFIQKEAGY